MLDVNQKERSYNAARVFVDRGNRYYGIHDVAVQNQGRTYWFKNAPVYIAYYNDFGDIRVSVIWEESTSTHDYKELGLHGTYSSNYEIFILEGKDLLWNDGESKVTVFK